ncbi:HupE/UreJ family protein, partial [Streptomyces sp. NPDC002346]
TSRTGSTVGWKRVGPSSSARTASPCRAISVAALPLLAGMGPEAYRDAGEFAATFRRAILHGLGFAGALSVDGQLSVSTLVDLVSFNLGIELAQLTIIAVAFPALLLLRRAATAPAAARTLTLGTVAATLAVAGSGLVWFVERSPLLT